MASKTRRTFTDEFKAETVALLESSGRPLSQVAQELGIEQSVLRTWRRRLRSAAAAQPPRVATPAGNGHAAVVSGDMEIWTGGDMRNWPPPERGRC